MRGIFRAITAFSLRFRIVTITAALLVMAAGGVAVTQLNQELLPPVEFPQTIVLAQVSGLTSEEALSFLTERLETRLAKVPGIVNIESTTTGAIGSVLTLLSEFGMIKPACCLTSKRGSTTYGFRCDGSKRVRAKTKTRSRPVYWAT